MKGRAARMIEKKSERDKAYTACPHTDDEIWGFRRRVRNAEPLHVKISHLTALTFNVNRTKSQFLGKISARSDF